MKRKLVPLLARLRREHPDVVDVESLIVGARVRVGGVVILNPRALVDAFAPIVIDVGKELRGTVKLRAALETFAIAVEGRTCLDVGASTGGFTTALLERGARRVYAVDAGVGQLLGSLRLDARVVNLERTNLASLDEATVPEAIDIVTLDLSYLSIANALPQLARVFTRLSEGAELVLLVKPMFELARASAPADEASLEEALALACIAVEAAGLRVVSTMNSRVTGARGARELLVHARLS